MSEQALDLTAAMQALIEGELLGAGAKPGDAGAARTGAPASAAQFRQTIADIASAVLKIPAERLDAREAMSRYGVDSIIVTEIMKRVSDVLGVPIAPTVFFEARHLEELADILFQRYVRTAAPAAPASAVVEAPAVREEVAASAAVVTGTEAERWIARFRETAAPRPPAVTRPAAVPPVAATPAASGSGYEPVAIIAMEGRFADSADLDELERHLRQGDDCIREVPADRWDWRRVHGDPQQGEFTNVKYGGFTPDIDKFDPLFFGMSPREAEMMDPQHRLFIQCVWKLIESAGYAPKSLSGRKVGLFVGINLQDYALLVDRAGAIEALHLTSLGHMFCPNRLSFLLDTHGPSQVIDTACSSSLVALHRAVLSVQHEGCEMAIAGGANLMITPDMHIMYSKVGMICEDGRCKTFSSRANGYARGDGVGAVLLKPLAQAERDGDTILAVVRGSAENHGGASTSLTAPNPKAQASLIVEAHRRAGVDPRGVGCIECHGTGTALGDPIEINGLKMAFEELHRAAGIAMPDSPYCGLGSVKSNIGHAETAAGIAGVIRATLAIRQGRRYRTLHCDDVNPMIELEGSPFFIQRHDERWERPVIDGVEQPRRAGVSSFGAGGSNAHVVIEEYVAAPLPPVRRPAPALVVLSARTAERLDDMVRNLLRFLRDTPEAARPDLADIAYTLQVGRDPMPVRLALVADSPAELTAALARLAEGGEGGPGCHRGEVKRTRKRTADGEEAAPALPASLDGDGVRRLAELWVRGVEIDWPALYERTAFPGRRPRRVTLPTYPFARQRCWIPEASAAHRRERPGAMERGVERHPLVTRDTSRGTERRFTAELGGTEFFLADHVVLGNKVLPGVAYLEMARAAAEAATGAAGAGIRLRNVVWARPFAVGDRPAALHVALTPGRERELAFRIHSIPDAPDAETVLHSQGTVVLPDPSRPAAPGTLDVAALRDAITGGQPDRHRLTPARCYAAFRAMGIAYGPGHQGLVSVHHSAPGVGNPQVLAELALPAAVAGDAAAFVLHPGLMDSALQACIGLLPASGHALPGGEGAAESAPTAALPFALEEFELLAPPPDRLWAWIRHAEGSAPSDRVRKLDIDLCDERGRVCVRMRGFSSRSPEPKQANAPESNAAEPNAVLMARPVWIDQPAPATTGGPAWARHRVVLCDLDGAIPASAEREIASALPAAACLRLPLRGAVQDWYREAALGVFAVLREEITGKGTGRALVQVVVPGGGDAALLGGLSGLIKTANRESSRLFAQLVEVDGMEGLAAALLADGGDAGQPHVRHAGARRQVLRWDETERPARPPAPPWKDNGVYLITGGAGGLGLLFAQAIARDTRNAAVVLCGRSAPDASRRAALDALSSAGLDVRYRVVDVTRKDQVEALVAEVVRTFGRIDGVLHCAGLLRDNFIVRKPAAEFAEVFAPKVTGLLHLDAATSGLDLDFMALFGSAAGAWGSAGQADYAAANAFLDAFAHHRNALARDGRRRGHTVAIDWALWADGGMRMESQALAMMRRTTGMDALPGAEGTRAFTEILASGAPQVLVIYGAQSRLRPLLTAPAVPVAETADEGGPADTQVDIQADVQTAAERMLRQAVATLMKFDLLDIDADTEWSNYGFDSISLTEFSNTLNQRFRLELTPTVFFEHATIAELAVWLAAEHRAQLGPALGLNPPTPTPPTPTPPPAAAPVP
ncbi:MAG TPA: SDR family NAD(P)-dependent oxidoreductase, partial [Azospirillum sp.]